MSYKERERRRRNSALAKRRNTLTTDEWQALELALVSVKRVIDANPEHEHALWHAYADLRDFTGVA